MKLNIIGGELTNEEVEAYVEHIKSKNPDKELAYLELNLDGDYVDMNYTFANNIPFERIRRITGYLVGTVDRFNNAKQAEEKARVKHDLERVML